MNRNEKYSANRLTTCVLSISGGKCSMDIFDDGSKETKTTPAVFTAPTNEGHATSIAWNQSTQAAQVLVQMKNEVARNKQRAIAESFDLFGSDPIMAKPINAVGAAIKKQTDADVAVVPSSDMIRVSSNRFASATKMNSYNVITSRPTFRVLQPPGGKSSDIIFG